MPLLLILALLLTSADHAGADAFAVGVVGSDDTALSDPVARDTELTTEQIEAMVRRAVDLVGGMAAVVPDSARLVALKPNITMAKLAGSGVITDPRVIRAVAILVHEVNPQARILIAEAPGGWQSPALKDCTDVKAWDQWIVDGFEVGGYRDVVTELQAAGIDIDCHDMNFDRGIRLSVPGGGLSRDEYDISSTIMEADIWINVPVAKTHGVKISVALKNHFGIMPGTLYGWPKRVGTEGHEGVPHMPQVVDEALIDLWTLTRVDFNVVDMIRGAEAGAFFGKPKHANIVLAGRDPVAVDLTSAQLMGFNPDDLETGVLAARQGMGPGSFESVDVRGGDVDVLRSRWRKAGASYGSSGPWGQWKEQANYGMGPRYWTLLGPIDNGDGDAPEVTELRASLPTPGEDGWSEITWFGHDKIDLDRLFDDPSHVTAYAFTQFHMPKADSVRYWFGSDEGMEVWIDGESVYQHKGRRKHRLGTDRIAGYLEAGEHRLLVKATQGRGTFDFSVNICEPIDDDFYGGNRYPGLKYYVQKRHGEVEGRQLSAQVTWYPWYSAESERTLEDADPLASAADVDSFLVDFRAPAARDLMGVVAHVAGLTDAALDSLTLVTMSHLPFGMGHYSFGMEGYPESYGPSPGRILNWLGVKYAVDSGNSQREIGKLARGWLDLGYLPLIDNQAWGVVSGYKEGDLFHFVSADTAAWMEMRSLGWSRLPGNRWGVNTIVAVSKSQTNLDASSLVDSIAAVAVEMARLPFNLEPNAWGARRAWTGLAAWDRWVVDWERQPWTASWAREEWPRDRLESMRDDLESFAEKAETSAAYFELAASQSSDDRRKLLSKAAEGFGTVGELMRELETLMPQSSAGEESDEERARLDGIERAAPLVRQARDAQRQALTALARLVGAELPTVVDDPLTVGDPVHVLSWQSSNNLGVYELVVENGELTQSRVAGRIAEEVEAELALGGADLTGAKLEVKRITGPGAYLVWEQPTADNGWRAVIRIDDEDNWGQVPTEIEVWAVR